MQPAIQTGDLDQTVYESLRNALASLIDSQPKDNAILAEMLTLPSTNYIAEQCEAIDPLQTYTIRDKVQSQLAHDLSDRFTALYQQNQAESFSLSSQAMSDRALKNKALDYLVATERPEHYQTAYTQYTSANNMTDRMAAFGALVHSGYEQSDVLIDHFFEQWQDDALVLDKWFAMQATIPRQATVSSVQSLLTHSAFSINNPNKVRSLIGAFTVNIPGFHQVDGAGYEFLADRILELNDINPQIAARLVGTFNNWKRYDSPYSGLMKAQLERINAEPELTVDVREIVSKALI